MSKLTVKIITPTGLVKEAEVEEVIIPALYGEMGILAEHISLLSDLTTGAVKLVSKEKTEEVFIKSGTCEVKNNICTILAEEIIDLANQNSQEIDVKIAGLNNDLKSGINSLSEKEINKLQSELKSLEIIKAVI
jgi:ATP synthase F1 epsilon subunit